MAIPRPACVHLQTRYRRPPWKIRKGKTKTQINATNCCSNPDALTERKTQGTRKKRSRAHPHRRKSQKQKGNSQKRELPVDSWPETDGQKYRYEGSKHSIWAHAIGQHHLPPVSGRTTTGTSRFSLLWSAPTRFWPHFLAFSCPSPV